MIRKCIISCFFTFCICLNAFSQGISISPSSAEQGDYISVNVYGDNQSDFYNLCNWGLDEYPSLRLYNIFSGSTINLSNNAWMDWSGGSIGYYPTSLSIPNTADTGMYVLQKRDCNYQWQTIAYNVFNVLPDVVQPPQIISVNPSSGDQGEILQVTITGSDVDFGQYSNTYSDFRFSQWSGTNMFYGQPYNAYQTNQGTQLHGYVSISSNQPIGQYDLEVFDLNTQNWVMMSGAFYVMQGNNSGISISPSSAEQGDYLSVNVYGDYRSDFYNLCNWGLDEYPSLRLYNIFSGSTINLSNNAGWIGLGVR